MPPCGGRARRRRRDCADRLAGQGPNRCRRLRRRLRRLVRLAPHRRVACEPPRAVLVVDARARPDRGSDRHLGAAAAGPDDRRHRHPRRRLGGRVRDLAVRHGLRGAEPRSPARCARRYAPGVEPSRVKFRNFAQERVDVPNPCNCVRAWDRLHADIPAKGDTMSQYDAGRDQPVSGWATGGITFAATMF